MPISDSLAATRERRSSEFCASIVCSGSLAREASGYSGRNPVNLQLTPHGEAILLEKILGRQQQ